MKFENLILIFLIKKIQFSQKYNGNKKCKITQKCSEAGTNYYMLKNYYQGGESLLCAKDIYNRLNVHPL
jgi:hypothetical protein